MAMPSSARIARPALILISLAAAFLVPAASTVAPHHDLQASAPVEIVASHLREPSGLAHDPATGDLYIAEADTGVILRVTSDGRFWNLRHHRGSGLPLAILSGARPSVPIFPGQYAQTSLIIVP
jgi:hypothetical protein